MLSKAETMQGASGEQLGRGMALFGGVLWLAAMSAPLVESDLYRYAVILLTILGFAAHFKANPRLKFGWLAWLCFGWGAYVTIRFFWAYFLTPGYPIGTSEWLYLFPVFFPALGKALYAFRLQIELVLAAFFALALVMLLVLTDYASILSGAVVSPLIHHNQIHGAVGCGMLVIGAFYWLLHCTMSKNRSRHFAQYAMVVAPPVIALALFAIYGAKSKGVWFAMSIVLPLMFLSLLVYMRSRTAGLVIVVLVALSTCGVMVAKNNMIKVAGPTAFSAATLLEKLGGEGTISENLRTTIASGDVPVSMNERLKLWVDASEVIAKHPVFGAGSLWLDEWAKTSYRDITYNLIHNGYLEILVRHGLFGLAVFAVMTIAFVAYVYRAWRSGLIGISAVLCHCMLLLFFMLTLLSNSNNRLAVGESFSLLFAAVAFSCYEMRRRLPEAQDQRQDRSDGVGTE